MDAHTVVETQGRWVLVAFYKFCLHTSEVLCFIAFWYTGDAA